MNNLTAEHDLPNAITERFQNPGYEDDYEHGVDCFEPPSDTAMQVASSKLAQLDDDAMTIYIVTNDFHDFLLQMQHWCSRGLYVGNSSAITCTEKFQSAKLFRPLF